MTIHTVSSKIDDDLFTWLKERVKTNGTSQAKEIEKCLRLFVDAERKLSDAETMSYSPVMREIINMPKAKDDGVSLTSITPPVGHIEEVAAAIVAGKLGNLYRPTLTRFENKAELMNEGEPIRLKENELSPREVWYTRHNLKQPESKPKPLRDFAQLADKYPGFGDDE